jgi:uncharacterized membrane protein YdcZ (DUF606 family)
MARLGLGKIVWLVFLWAICTCAGGALIPILLLFFGMGPDSWRDLTFWEVARWNLAVGLFGLWIIIPSIRKALRDAKENSDNSEDPED